jgi:extracellular elastinolytic metalloproteinase
MRRLVSLGILSVLVAVLAPLALAQDEPMRFDGQSARVYSTGSGRMLTLASTAAPASIVAGFLRAHNRAEATLRSLVTVAENRVKSSGITHLRLEQEITGLRVWGAYVKAAVNERGELVHLIDSLAPLPASPLVQPRIRERQALLAALLRLYPSLVLRPVQLRREGNTTVFSRGRFFYANPTVTRVAVAMRDGSMQVGFLVETWSQRSNLLHDTLIGGNGRILDVELRTNNDSYNVFTVDPDTTPQAVVAGPGAGNAQSPIGWLAGSQNTVSIAGNNAHAYLDTDADNAPDPGGTAVADGNFLATADLTQSPSTAANKEVAVQNLFYLNNLIHDELYSHGFTEAAGNFQENNFGKGGRGGDSVNAEAQDGSGTDNANFATPRDGQNPRMQMYLWTGKGDHQVVVNSPASIAGTYRAQGAVFGPALDATGITGDVVLVDDGTGTTSDGCEAITNAVGGKIALIDRGNCTFVVKVKNAQNAGAVAAIVANNAGDSIFTMGGTDATITIPSVFIGKSDGGTIKSRLNRGVNATERLTDPPPLQRDGDVDSDVVRHEACHGLTWRMIGRMSGVMAGAIGEGMSDVCAIVNNDNDVLGEYSFDDPLGIRSAPYTNYPRTYGDFTGTEVHFDGEIYAAIGWKLWQIFQANGLSKDLFFDDVVDGMNFTPAGPTFEEMRDGILQSVANKGLGHECLVWQAFGSYGVGVGAKAQVRGSTVIITESFALPPGC